MTAPPPAGVRGNDWRELAVAPIEFFEPTMSATVVVPYYQAPEALALTLAGLEGQTYPRELFEVIVVDDGSDPPLELAGPTPLRVRVIYQEDLGFGLARARNNGVREAGGDIISFLDCDMVPEAGWLAAHARWHHAACDVVSMGFRKHVDVAGIDAEAVRSRRGSLADLFAARPAQSPPWIERRMARTGDLTAGTDDVFRVVTGGNFAVSAEFFAEVGGFDESFTQWGDEDIEFGWRAHALGALLAPERSALCWHQGPGAVPSEAERASLAQQREKISHLIPDWRLRSAAPGRSFTVPQFVVTVEPGACDEDTVLATVEQVLASEVHDLVVWVEERPAERLDRLRRLLGGDPRVDVGAVGGAASAYPAAAFYVRLPAGAPIKPRMVGRLRVQLKAAASGESDLASGHRVAITRSWALNRARRCGLVASDVGTVVELDVDSLKVEHQPQPQSKLASRLQGPVKVVMRVWTTVRRGLSKLLRLVSKLLRRVSKLLRRLPRLLRIPARMGHHLWILLTALARIRKRSDLKRLGTKIIRGIRWRALRTRGRARWARRRMQRRVRRARGRTRGRVRWARRRMQRRVRGTRMQLKIWLGLQGWKRDPVPRLARYPLGAEIAVSGRDAAAVFAASARVAAPTGDRHVDLLLVDSAEAERAVTGDLSPDAQPVVAVLDQMNPLLRVQAFDAEAVNPVGWSAVCEPDAPTLRSCLPAPGAVHGHLMLGDTLLQLRAAHHLEDRAKFHKGAAQRAATLAALAAAGVLVHITDGDEALARCLGADLHDLMANDRVATASAHEREQLSIAMRRCALRDHSLRSRSRQVLGSANFDAPLPEVSILAPTRRPERLGALIDAVGAQTYPRLELVLALHGEGFAGDAEMAKLLASLKHSVQVVRVDGVQPLGAVLRAAAAAAGGTLLTKMDDDDFYAREHVWDLVLAHEYSGAALVGKSAEYVYLQRRDQTLRDSYRQGFSERYVPFPVVSGGVLMIARHDLDGAGGWRRVPRHVDNALAQDVFALGGRIYWTHGVGYVRVRHGDEHTWTVDDSHFLGRASEVRYGCDLSFAGFD